MLAWWQWGEEDTDLLIHECGLEEVRWGMVGSQGVRGKEVAGEEAGQVSKALISRQTSATRVRVIFKGEGFIFKSFRSIPRILDL